MRVELKQHFQIESARFLPYLDKSHPCAHMHGHSFKIILSFVGEVDSQIGWLIDYHQVSQIMKPVLQQIDHRVLNEVSGLENPTSENLAKWVFDQLKPKISILTSVNISETPFTECIYSG